MSTEMPEMVEYANGSRQWYLNGKLHREDGPAVEHADGTRKWYLNGKRHRDDFPAVERADGYRSWYLNGKRHRTDGPAIEEPITPVPTHATRKSCWLMLQR